jgi:peptidoglycan/LPS O-acetylase OafA/YrhL
VGPHFRSAAERDVALDAFRFIAALGILLHHCAIYADVMRWNVHVTAFDNFRLCVDFFFALSGFVLMHVYGGAIRTGNDYVRFLQKRFARIYPLHALMVIVFVVLALAVAGKPMAERIAPVLEPAAALPNLMLLHSFGITQTLSLDFPSWSISAEWFLYLLFPTLAAFVLRIGPRGAIISAIVFALMLAIAREAFGLRDWTRSTFDFGMLRALPSFVAGMAVCGFIERAPLRRLSWNWVYGAGLLLIALMLSPTPAAVTIALFPAFIGLVALADRSGRPTFLTRSPFPALGDASYSVYMLHALVMLVAAEATNAAGMKGLLALAALTSATIAMTIPLALISFRFYEAPMRRWLSPSATPTYRLRPAARRRSIASE